MQVLILLSDSVEQSMAKNGLQILRDLGVSFQLRTVSALKSAEHGRQVIEAHQDNEGQVIICVDNSRSYLPALAASTSSLPVLSVSPQFEQLTAGVPIANLGDGEQGFVNACFFAAQYLSQSNDGLKKMIMQIRKTNDAKLVEADQLSKVEFHG